MITEKIKYELVKFTNDEQLDHDIMKNKMQKYKRYSDHLYE